MPAAAMVVVVLNWSLAKAALIFTPNPSPGPRSPHPCRTHTTHRRPAFTTRRQYGARRPTAHLPVLHARPPPGTSFGPSLFTAPASPPSASVIGYGEVAYLPACGPVSYKLRTREFTCCIRCLAHPFPIPNLHPSRRKSVRCAGTGARAKPTCS